MKIFVCEFITSGGYIGQKLPSKLATEGDMMLQAVLNDLHKINYLDITVTRDSRLDKLLNVEQLLIIGQEDNVFSIWENCFKASDACLIIAPETDNILYKLHELAENNNCEVFGCNIKAIELCSSKVQCLIQLNKFDVLVPQTQILENSIHNSFPFVIKPDDGVGCENCYLIQSKSQLETILQSQHDVSNWIKQEYISGIDASISVLIYNNHYMILSINKQGVYVVDDKFILSKLIVNEYSGLKERLKSEIKKILSAIPSLSGIIGIDIVVTKESVYVLEINPRLTTSYYGLSQSININPMEYLLSSFNNKRLDVVDINVMDKPIINI